MLDICKMEPAVIEIYRQQVPTLCKILRSLVVSGFSADYDVSGITDPFLQVKVPKAGGRRSACMRCHQDAWSCPVTWCWQPVCCSLHLSLVFSPMLSPVLLILLN